MKKVSGGFLVLFLVIALVLAFLWISKASLFARLLSREFHTKVTIERLGYSSGRWLIYNLHILNPPKSTREDAFVANKIEIDASFRELLQERMTMDLIEMDDVTLEIELYTKDASSNNWALLLAKDTKKSAKVKESQSEGGKKRKYLIRKIIVRNMTVLLTDEKGTTKKLGTIPVLEFDNISDESGIPINEIEKIIFNMILKSIIQQFGLDALKKLVDPSFVVPTVLPQILPYLSNP